eukprot:CAMPEP_0172297440 /NCGR_PEP_ID=MMETSP1058-20130122/463_1 /TAXON_ID=83371 /ORGANISM="Detonula confervacea, Strain CCMP 353" /LENGTH=742 /DNA_ID=CAMNT_0013006595 /DNA_START=59 /DNA_END=2284 /DNA_ORIENTATION=-
MTRQSVFVLVAFIAPIFVVQSFQPPVAFFNRLQHNVGLYPKSTNTELYATPSKPSNTQRNWKKKRKYGRKRQEELKNPKELETWRMYGIDVNPDALGTSSMPDKRKEKETDSIPPERSYLTPPVLSSLLSRLRIKQDISIRSNSEDLNDTVSLPPQLKDARVIRRSIDARRRKGADPNYTFVIEFTLTRAAARDLNLTHQPGRIERMSGKQLKSENAAKSDETPINEGGESSSKPKVVIVGAGPAGLFCALSLASSGLFTPILLERGQSVEARGKSIGALINRRLIDPESNFSFGEGGAGTWSDGKLTTRIGRNSGAVRFVLETLVKYGAPERILVEGAPHLGTDNLVRLLRNMRSDLRSMGGEIHFGACVNKFHIEDKAVTGVDAKCKPTNERIKTSNGEGDLTSQEESTKTFSGDAVVLATGHSARDVYYELEAKGVELEAKGFAVGFRIEHPQRLINEIQYGKDWGGRVFTRRMSTDAANVKHFENDVEDSDSHTGTLPVASYRLATNKAFDGDSNRGAYSFCQCPGGQIVPSSTEDGELCINGMSFSKRDSLWANSALVVTVSPDDSILEPYRLAHGSLAGLEFQRDMERKAWEFGGGGMRAPVQRLTDFVNQKTSESVPSSSYRLGVKSAACHDIYPQPLYNALAHAITHHFDKQMPGFLCDEALLHGVETRTSSPVRVIRDANTLEASGVDNLFPSGEGAGFAGGIVSAAVDGLLVANAIKAKFYSHDKSTLFDGD